MIVYRKVALLKDTYFDIFFGEFPSAVELVRHTRRTIIKTTIHHATLGLQRRIYLRSLRFAQIVMADVLFLLLRRFSGTVFLNILGLLNHLQSTRAQLLMKCLCSQAKYSCSPEFLVQPR